MLSVNNIRRVHREGGAHGVRNENVVLHDSPATWIAYNPAFMRAYNYIPKLSEAQQSATARDSEEARRTYGL